MKKIKISILLISLIVLPPSIFAACPSAQAVANGGFQTSSIVSASFSPSGIPGTATYLFNSLTNTNAVSGVPGLIEYCVYPSSNPDLGNVTALATGVNSGAWQAIEAVGRFSFGRPDGNPSNIALDGTSGIIMGTANWTSNIPTNQTILLHINDQTECTNLYGGGASSTCFVFPGGQPPPPACNGNPACKTATLIRTDTNQEVSLSSVPVGVPLTASFSYVIVNNLLGNVGMIFKVPLPSTKDINNGGGKDYFGCEWIPKLGGNPGGFGKFLNYQNTKLDLTLSHTGGSCDQSRFSIVAGSLGAQVLTTGNSISFNVDVLTRINKGKKQEYTSCGLKYLNSGFTIKWIQSDDKLLHSFATDPISVNVVGCP